MKRVAGGKRVVGLVFMPGVELSSTTCFSSPPTVPVSLSFPEVSRLPAPAISAFSALSSFLPSSHAGQSGFALCDVTLKMKELQDLYIQVVICIIVPILCFYTDFQCLVLRCLVFFVLSENLTGIDCCCYLGLSKSEKLRKKRFRMCRKIDKIDKRQQMTHIKVPKYI